MWQINNLWLIQTAEASHEKSDKFTSDNENIFGGNIYMEETKKYHNVIFESCFRFFLPYKFDQFLFSFSVLGQTSWWSRSLSLSTFPLRRRRSCITGKKRTASKSVSNNPRTGPSKCTCFWFMIYNILLNAKAVGECCCVTK